jgi:predicted ATPase
VLLDEPELGLHPFAVTVLAGLIKSLSLYRQIVLATQSTPLLDHFDPQDVVVVDRTDRVSTFRRLDPVALADWLEEYSLGELWEKNVLGGRPGR